MDLKQLLFGGGAKAPAAEPFRDSIQAWLPIKNIVGGVVVLALAAEPFRDSTIIQNTSGPREADDFWSRAELNLLTWTASPTRSTASGAST